MHQLIIAATSNFKVLSIRDKQSGSAIRSEVNIGHIICGRGNIKQCCCARHWHSASERLYTVV